MRKFQILLTVISLLAGCGIAFADNALTLKATIGFNGYYRPHTLVPIQVDIKNDGDEIHGEFRVTSQTDKTFSHHYVAPYTIPRQTEQHPFLYVTPQAFANDITVEYFKGGERIATCILNSCQELYGTSRLLVVVGGNGSSFNYMGSQQVQLNKPNAIPRPWDLGAPIRQQSLGFNGNPGNPNNSNGFLQVAYIDKAKLPDNPEAYGSISTLTLMSDITENTLPAGAQEAIPLWVASGGHLVVAGGGITSRFQAPFFAKLLPNSATTNSVMRASNGGQATTRPLGAGKVTALNYDPDMATANNLAAFYKKLFTKDPDNPASIDLHDTINQAVMVRNLQPPNLTLIIIYLLVYLVTLVPLNYFVLKKIDKREMAWITTPIIVLLFTLGAYGIGYATKGHRLVLNQMSVVETSANQTMAEAVSDLLIFSPSRTTYNLDLGENGLLAHELSHDDDSSPMGNTSQQFISSASTTVDTNGKLEMRDIGVNMWDFRQFAMAHEINLQGGFTAHLTANAPGTSPRAAGTITNNTPYRFQHCELYCSGTKVAEFALDSKGSVTVEKMSGTQVPSFNNEDEKHMYETMQAKAANTLCTSQQGNEFLLLGYTTDTLLQTKLSGHAPTTTLSVFVVHL